MLGRLAMDLYQEYQQEKYDRRTIYKLFAGAKVGFLSYNIYSDKSCYIDTLFIQKGFRGKGYAQELEAEVIKKENPKVIYCEVDLTANNPEEALGKFMHKGYKIDKQLTGKILLKKYL